MRIENEINIEESHFIPSSFYWTVELIKFAPKLQVYYFTMQ